jgi:hypothetical protein
MYTQLVGLEHLQTGVKIESEAPVQFWRESATIFALYSVKSFKLSWKQVRNGRTVTISISAYEDTRVNVPTPESEDYIRELVQDNGRRARA